jgi:hypothetical protein
MTRKKGNSYKWSIELFDSNEWIRFEKLCAYFLDISGYKTELTRIWGCPNHLKCIKKGSFVK